MMFSWCLVISICSKKWMFCILCFKNAHYKITQHFRKKSSMEVVVLECEGSLIPLFFRTQSLQEVVILNFNALLIFNFQFSQLLFPNLNNH